MTVQIMGGGGGSNLQVANTINVGGLVLSSTGLKILQTNITSGYWSSFWDATPGSSGGVYQVPGGQSFRLLAVRYDHISGGAGNKVCGLTYADTNVGFNAISPPAVLVNETGLISGVTVGFGNDADYCFSTTITPLGPFEKAVGGVAPTGKYLYLTNATIALFGNATIYGIEV